MAIIRGHAGLVNAKLQDLELLDVTSWAQSATPDTTPTEILMKDLDKASADGGAPAYGRAATLAAEAAAS